MSGQRFFQTTTIASGGTTSGAVNIENRTLVGVIMPAAFTGTTITFTASSTEGGTYTTSYKTGADQSYDVAASKLVEITPSNHAATGSWIKVVSGSAEGADRSLVVVSREID